jgi:hypothetical protein
LPRISERLRASRTGLCSGKCDPGPGDHAGGLAVEAELLRRFHGEHRTINPDLERFMAKRMGAKTIEVKASHLSLISHPDEITRLIMEAAGQPD